MSDYGQLPQIYARLAEAVKRDLIRVQGLSETDAEARALEVVLKQAQDMAVGMGEVDARQHPAARPDEDARGG